MLEINYKEKNVKNTNTWRLNNTLLNNQEITEEIKEEIRKYLETNDNGDTTTQNLWNAAKAVLRGEFIAIQSYLKKRETSQMNNLPLHLKQLEKEEQQNPKVSSRKEIIKLRSETNEKENMGIYFMGICQWILKCDTKTTSNKRKKIQWTS